MKTEIKWLIIAVLVLGFPTLSLAASERSDECGFMCHLPMAYQGGESHMAWRGLGYREGTFEKMAERFIPRRAHDVEWQQFLKVLKLPHGTERQQRVLKAFSKFLAVQGGSARKAHDRF
jgi:hypothetical protein